MSKSKLLNTKDLIAYFLVAGTGASVQLLSGSFLRNKFALSYSTSVSLGYFIAFFVGFFLTKMFAFDARNTNQTRREMVKFMMVATGSWAVTWFFAVASLSFVESMFGKNYIVVPFFNKTINANELGCQVIGMGFSFVFNYIMHKTFTFQSTGFYDRLKTLLK
ncbi:MAG: GtrA family protein [Flectobacillus sp.]|nr:GtrA family protein [Flectobacillus sp.]